MVFMKDESIPPSEKKSNPQTVETISRGTAGGLARAKSLSPEQRKDIAERAAFSRWNTDIAEATHSGELKIGELILSCAVLADGRRVLSERGVSRALGRTRGGSDYRKKREIPQNPEGEVPVFIGAIVLKDYITTSLKDLVSKPIYYRDKRNGNKVANGVDATLLPQICDVWLKARDAGVLNSSQKPIATQADILMRGLAQVGIISLVDEATGYQEIRDRLALQAILDQYLRKEFAAWAKVFPDEFYQEIFRLRKWKWKGMKVNRPQAVAGYTKNIVYARLAPGILAELEKRNPLNVKGSRKAKHHQLFTEDIGHPRLSEHMHTVLALMRISDEWGQFQKMLDRALPKRGDSLQLPLFTDEEVTRGS